MFDSGNRFAPLMALGTALNLGFRSRDFSSDRRVLQSIGGVELLTAGTIKVRYYLAGNFDRLHETDFHILEQLAGDYEVNLPTEQVEAHPIIGVPIVAATVAKKRAPTDAELRLLEDRIRQVEELADLAEKERAMRKAAEREKREKIKAKAKIYP
ncbi:hypothetical protein NEMBOFW57_003584 [Staphylotrichum longicolle]|uniref:Uncharacterized protein n=1 Tax=Staphylotrichum longicolle TaxID=669026 RepID=A0AAD4F5I5_9PEZI|nr:hypothetical protein NEMBOFW57_003584 [Staphylotrichum longicolle]